MVGWGELFHLLVHSPKAANSQIGSGGSQELSRSLMGVMGVQAAGPSAAAFPVALARSWIGNRVAKTQATTPVWIPASEVVAYPLNYNTPSQ